MHVDHNFWPHGHSGLLKTGDCGNCSVWVGLGPQKEADFWSTDWQADWQLWYSLSPTARLSGAHAASALLTFQKHRCWSEAAEVWLLFGSTCKDATGGKPSINRVCILMGIYLSVSDGEDRVQGGTLAKSNLPFLEKENEIILVTVPISFWSCLS